MASAAKKRCLPSFDAFECNRCGTDFKALPDAPAAETGYCSPACQTAGEGLA